MFTIIILTNILNDIRKSISSEQFFNNTNIINYCIKMYVNLIIIDDWYKYNN